jgi:hypothetical protein
LESACNDYFSILSDNNIQLNELRKACECSDNIPTILWGFPQILPENLSILNDLLCLQMKNRLYSLSVAVRKYNHAIQTVTQAVQDLQNALISGKISIKSYCPNMRSLASKIDKIIEFSHLLEDKVLFIAAFNRLRLERDLPQSWRRFVKMPTAIPIRKDEIIKKKK